MQLFQETFTIMIVGMSLVFFFIFIVIQCMNFIAFMIHRYEANIASNPPDAGEDNAAAQRHIAAAIAVATHPTSDKH